MPEETQHPLDPTTNSNFDALASVAQDVDPTTLIPPLPPHLAHLTPEKLAKLVTEARMRDNPQIQATGMPTLTTQSLPTTPVYLPTGMVIDWIDAVVDVRVQLVRMQDKAVYDFATATFKLESNLPNQGLTTLSRPYVGLKAAYQVLEVQTPKATFLDGWYRIFYFGKDNEFLDVGSVGVFSGVPFQGSMFPANVIPTVVDIVVKILHADLTKHDDPNTPGRALNTILRNFPQGVQK